MLIFLRKIIKFNREKGREGIAIYLAAVTLSIVLAIALSVGALSASRLKNLNEAGDSVTAFAAAETGIERSLSDYNSTPGTFVDGYAFEENLGGGIGYKISVKTCGGSGQYICITSIGSYRNARRAVKVEL
jgi:hypothetical protein